MPHRGHVFIHKLRTNGYAPLPPVIAVIREQNPLIERVFQILKCVVVRDDTARKEQHLVFEDDGCFQSSVRVPCVTNLVDMYVQDVTGLIHPVVARMTIQPIPSPCGNLPVLIIEPSFISFLLPPYCVEVPIFARDKIQQFLEDETEHKDLFAFIDRAIADGATCPITMNRLKKTETVVTACFHLFERGALQEWLHSNASCPVCRCEPLELLLP